MSLTARLKAKVLCGKTTRQEGLVWTCARLKGHESKAKPLPHQSAWRLFPVGQKVREKQYAWSS